MAYEKQDCYLNRIVFVTGMISQQGCYSYRVIIITGLCFFVAGLLLEQSCYHSRSVIVTELLLLQGYYFKGPFTATGQ